MGCADLELAVNKWEGQKCMLQDPRSRVRHARLVTILLKLDIVLRVGAVVATYFACELTETRRFLWSAQLEAFCMVLLLAKYGRWEDQEHWITLWEALYAILIVRVRMSLFSNPALLLVAFCGLYATYAVGVMTEFTKVEEARLPPFCPKSQDEGKPKCGWLGLSICTRIPRNCRMMRMLLTCILYMGGIWFTLFIMYAFFMSSVDDLRNTAQAKEGQSLLPLLWVAAVGGIVGIIPLLSVELGSIPGLIFDCVNFKKASRSYNTGVFDICEIDEDDKDGSELKEKMKATPCLPITIVFPCYLPNEEEILPLVIDFYEEQLKKYPAESKILIVWNSPRDHDEFEAKMEERKQQFPGLVCIRNTESTSKCDNLNFACKHIDTEICCLNDADTMLDWATMVRGSHHITEGYDIAQAMNTHCKFDRNGTPGDEHQRECHPYGILITIGDSTKAINMSTQSTFKHAPFNGRGGFWRSSALRLVGFDHRTVGEDHDAGYRGCMYFGFKGILDMNMLCQEQEPPDCKSLTSQRIRWETAALELRRTFSWALRSPFYGRWECFILLWSQLAANCNLPFQALPFQVAVALPFIVVKGYVSNYVFGKQDGDPSLWDRLCSQNNCALEFTMTSWRGEHWDVALPLALVVFFAILLLYVVMSGFDFCLRLSTTRYRPKCLWFTYYAVLKGLCTLPFFIYAQYWALYDYCWGGAKFIATARSPLGTSNAPKTSTSPGLAKPLLQKQ